VIYSNADACNYPRVLGDDLIVVHNPLAISPLPRGFLHVGRECWREDKTLVIHTHDALTASGGQN